MTTKTIIRKSTTSATGYEIVFNDQVLPIEKKVLTKKGDDYSLVLPENPSNRQYFTIGRVEAAGGEIELTYKETKTFGPRTSTTPKTTTPKKDIREFMTDDEKAIYDDLMKKVENRMKRAAIIAQIEDLQKELGEEEA